MGQDLRMLFASKLSFDRLLQLPMRLNGMQKEFGHWYELARLPGVHWSWGREFEDPTEFKAWYREQAGKFKTVDLRGSAALWISFAPAMAELGCWVRWREFASNRDVMQAMRLIGCAVARAAGADALIYIPDSAWAAGERASEMSMYESASFAVMLEKLQASASDPLPFSAGKAINGYYLENKNSRPTTLEKSGN